MHRLSRAAASLAAGLLLGLPSAHAATMIVGATQTGLDIVVDGTSNTIQFGEVSTPTRITFCFDHVTSGAIADGTSNTILFGEGVQLRFIGGWPGPRTPIADISDGTSNTILFGEYTTSDFCIADVTVPLDPIGDGTSNTIIIGENSAFDVCFDNVRRGTVTDGTSNTILFGELQSNLCYPGAVMRETPSVLPEPGTLALLGAGLALIGLLHRRRRRQ